MDKELETRFRCLQMLLSATKKEIESLENKLTEMLNDVPEEKSPKRRRNLKQSRLLQFEKAYRNY